MTIDQRKLESKKFERAKLVYSVGVIAIASLLFFVFSQAIYNRVVYGFWERYGLQLKPSLITALDIHVIISVLFMLLLSLQFFLGLSQKKGNLANRRHPVLGKTALLSAPIFLVAAAWAVQARAFDDLLVELALYSGLLFIGIFFVQGYLAIKQHDYMKHLDSMVSAYFLISIAGLFRFVYYLIFSVYGRCPITETALAFFSFLVLYISLFVFYALAGRLKENWLLISFQIVFYLSIFWYFPWQLFTSP